MKILALELSSARGSIALREDGQTRFASEFANDRKHSGAFFENLQRVMLEFALPELIVVGIGPGSYAGVRIAIAAAIGLQAATGAQLTGLPSICAVADSGETFLMIGDARRQTFYHALIEKGACAEEPSLCSEDELRQRLAGVAVPVYCTEPMPNFPEARRAVPSATMLARLAESSPQQPTNFPLEPMYLREPHITLPKGTPFSLAGLKA